MKNSKKNNISRTCAAFTLGLLGVMSCSTETPPTAGSAPASPAATKAPPPEPLILDTRTYFSRCAGSLRDMSEVLRPIVDDLVAQKIPYTRKPANEWRDCSGNFLRLSSALAAVCTEQADELIAPQGVRPYSPQGDNAVPFDVPYRSSRAVAKWYHERGRFTPVFYDDAEQIADAPSALLQIRDQIRPGAVVWFSRGRPLSSYGIGALFEKTGSGSQINHMATVTAVERNDLGEVISYSMFHGHGKADKATPSSETKRQFFDWPPKYLKNGSVAYPPLGYWSQRLVGIGTLLPVEATVVPGAEGTPGT